MAHRGPTGTCVHTMSAPGTQKDWQILMLKILGSTRSLQGLQGKCACKVSDPATSITGRRQHGEFPRTVPVCRSWGEKCTEPDYRWPLGPSRCLIWEFSRSVQHGPECAKAYWWGSTGDSAGANLGVAWSVPLTCCWPTTFPASRRNPQVSTQDYLQYSPLVFIPGPHLGVQAPGKTCLTLGLQLAKTMRYTESMQETILPKVSLSRLRVSLFN